MSAKKRSDPSSGRSGGRGSADSDSAKPKKGRTSDLGRALRTVYDDTLREAVPDDFLNLIGKLK